MLLADKEQLTDDDCTLPLQSASLHVWTSPTFDDTVTVELLYLRR